MLKNLFSFNYEIFDCDTNLEFSYKTLGIILSNIQFRLSLPKIPVKRTPLEISTLYITISISNKLIVLIFI